jgi:hypothetical protein
LEKIVVALASMDRCDFELDLSRETLRDIVAPILPATTPELIASLYEHWGFALGKDRFRWGDKKPQHWQFVYRLCRWYPEAQFVHIMRDPRDAHASIEEHFPEQIIGRELVAPHVITSWQWRLANRVMLEQGWQLGPGRYLFLTYEDLVHDPERYCKRLCTFLGIDYAPEMLSFQRQAKRRSVQTATEVGRAHEHTTKSVHTGRIGRSRASLDESVIADIEFICGDLFETNRWVSRAPQIDLRRKMMLQAVCRALGLAWTGRRALKRAQGSM